MAGNQTAMNVTNTLTGMAEPNVIAKLKPKNKLTVMRTKNRMVSIGITLALIAIILSLFAIRMSGEKPQKHAPSTAVAWVKVVKPINDVSAVALIYDMQPHRLATSGGEGYITRGNEIYIKTTDSLAHPIRLSSSSYNATRCVQITADKYGWRVLNVFTRRQCKDLHYD